MFGRIVLDEVFSKILPHHLLDKPFSCNALNNFGHENHHRNLKDDPFSRLTIPNPPSVKKIAGEGGEGGPIFSPPIREVLPHSGGMTRRSPAIASDRRQRRQPWPANWPAMASHGQPWPASGQPLPASGQPWPATDRQRRQPRPATSPVRS